MYFSELRSKEVINQKTCKVLGCISDICIDEKNGCITAIIVPGPAKYCGFFGRDSEYKIPFCDVCCIGDDIVLVSIDEGKCLTKPSGKDIFKDTFF
jgi:YlmC/YmxH family sporulation protein